MSTTDPGVPVLPNPPVGDFERFGRTMSHAIAAAGGLGAILWPPTTVGADIGAIPPGVWGVALLVGGIIAAVASQTQRYLIEWPATIVIIIGLILYLVALWSVIADGNPSRSAQAFLITAYAFKLVSRTEHLRRLAGALKDIRRLDGPPSVQSLPTAPPAPARKPLSRRVWRNIQGG